MPNEIINFCEHKWRVLTAQNGQTLLITEYALEKLPYHNAHEDTTWENCTLRKYLNNAFYNSLGREKSRIVKSHIANDKNPWYGTNCGNASTDKIFLLSLEELVKYFGDSGDLTNKNRKEAYLDFRETHTTIKPAANGWLVIDQYNENRKATTADGEAMGWWLRPSGVHSKVAAYVTSDGKISVSGNLITSPMGVRPALWVK